MEETVLLRMTDITKTFPGVRALDHVSLEVKAGTVHALMGENGAGKSTLMKCLFGIYKKDAGTILMEGKEVNFINPRNALDNGVAMVHQELRQKQRKRARHRTRRRINPGVWKRILIMAAVVAAVVLSMVLFFRVRSVEVTGSAYYTADEIRAACGEDVFILALCHRNDQLPLWAGLGVPVVLAGHAHGGIVRLPGLGGVFGAHRPSEPPSWCLHRIHRRRS